MVSKLQKTTRTNAQTRTETESSPEQVAHLVNSMMQEDLLYLLAHSIRLLPFESRKDCQSIFSYVFRFKPANSLSSEPPAMAYTIQQRPEVIVELCRGYGYKESAMPCGVVLREILKQYEDVASIILHDESRENQRAISIDEIDPREAPVQTGEGVFWQFFMWIENGAFEVSTDAFTTFRVTLHGLQSVNAAKIHSGAPDATQTTSCIISREELRSLFRPIQYRLGPVKILRYEEAIDQTTGRAATGPSKLQHNDCVRRVW